MAGTTEFSIAGAEGIQKVLMGLPVQLQKRALYNAFKAGAEIVAEEARQKALRHGLPTSFTDDIIAGKPTRRQRLGKETVAVVALKTGHSGWGHILEFGTAERIRNSKSSRRGKKGNRAGGRTGRIAPHPFLRPALDIKANAATEAAARILRENVETITRQLAAGQKISLKRKK